MRKGQGLSVNMIILLVLGVIVLMVASFMFISKARNADRVTGSCVDLGGVCQLATEQCAAGNFFGTCPKTGDKDQRCCSRPDSQNTQT